VGRCGDLFSEEDTPLSKVVKRSVVLWVVALVFAASFVASAAQEKVTITHMHYAGHGEAWANWLKEMAAEFMKQNPNIVVDILPTTSGEYSTKMRTMYIADAGLDVVELGLTAVSNTRDGLFLDLMPYMENDKQINKSMWAQPVLNGFINDGMLWGMPMSIDLWVNWYNEDHFNRAGLMTPAQIGSGWTWEYLTNAGRKLTIDENGDGTIDQYGVDRAYSNWNYGLTEAASGARAYEKLVFPIQPNVNDPALKEGLRWITDMYVTYKITQPYGSNVTPYAFYNGKSSINIADNTGVLGRLTNANFNWNCARPVAGPGGSGTNLQMMGFEVMSNTKHPQQVWEWVKFLTARRESVERFMSVTGRLPAFGGAQSKFKELVKHAPKDWWILFEVINQPNTFTPYVHKVPGLNSYRSAALMNLVFTGQKAPEVALDEAQENELRLVKAFLEAEAAK
jgi:ABC-type glycerol-3-phosphate transport system substrate-binding protein